MDAQPLQLADLLERGDAAGGGEFERCGRAQAPEPVEVGPRQHSFLIHVGAQEARAVRLKLAEHFFGAEGRGLAPALDDDAAALGVERDDQPVAADPAAHGVEELPVHTAGLERRRAHDDPARALLDQFLRPFHGAHAAANARHGVGRQVLDDGVVGAASQRRIQVDHLDLGERGEPAQHLLRRPAFQRFLPALNELDHLAVHQVDARNDHAGLTATPCLARYSFRSPTV